LQGSVLLTSLCYQVMLAAQQQSNSGQQVNSPSEEAETPQMTCHLHNPQPAGAMGTGEGTALLTAFGTAMGTADIDKTKIHFKKSKCRHQAWESTARMKPGRNLSVQL